MSGPKSADYSVVDNPAVLAAARAQAWTAARESEARLEDLVRRTRKAVCEHGISPVSFECVPGFPESSADISVIERFITATRSAYSRIESQLERAIINQQIARMLSAAVVGVSGKLTTTEAALSGRLVARETAAGAAPIINLETRRERIQRGLERIEGIVSNADKETIQGLAGYAIGISEKLTFENLNLELQYRIQHANEAAREMLAQRECAAQLLAALRGLSGPDIDEVARELRQVELGEVRLRTNIEQSVEAVSVAAKRRADRDYAGRVFREEFERLGYQVEDGFQTIFVSGGTINLLKPGMQEYSAKMCVGSGQERLDLQVVRSSGSAAEVVSQERRARDREIEDEWCSDLAHIMAAIRQRSVQSRITHRVLSGVQPVFVVETEGGAARRREEDDQLGSRQN